MRSPTNIFLFGNHQRNIPALCVLAGDFCSIHSFVKNEDFKGTELIEYPYGIP